MNPDTNLPHSTPPKRGGVRLNVRGAGALILAKDTGRLLFAFRIADRHTRPHLVWNLWGGPVESNENPETSVVRWSKIQTGYKGQFADVIPLYTFFNNQTNFRYHNYLLIVENEFWPSLDRKLTEDYKWVEYGKWPDPLYPTVSALLREKGPEIIKIIEKNAIRESLLLKGNIIKLKDIIKNMILSEKVIY
jgi:ADP-ribose pyrophosphatase YjhB (NUDIX family)